MTETTSIQQFIPERHTYAPPVMRQRQPGLATLVAQAVVGSFLGGFGLLIARMFLAYDLGNSWYVFALPPLMLLGLATGVPAGLLIWAGARLAHGPLLTINRSLLGVLVMALAWFLLWFSEGITSEEQIWTLPMIITSGVLIGLLTGSRLRPGRELVRGGETNSTLLKILAGLTGLILRVVVVFLFLVYSILTISTLQSYYLGPYPFMDYQRTNMIWGLYLFGHLSAGTVILFTRMRFWLLAFFAVIAAAPVFAGLWAIESDSQARIVIIGYLGTWAMFLLTRWRQTDFALSKLKEELRYYLID